MIEKMLIKDFNEQIFCVESIAELIRSVRPQKAYLLVPTRPPAQSDITRPSSESLKKAAAIIKGLSGVYLECITGDKKEEGFFYRKYF